MAAMKCLVHGPLGETDRRFCPDCMEFLIPDLPPEPDADHEPAALLCPEPECDMELEPDGGCPVHSLGDTPRPLVTRLDASPRQRRRVVDFPWGAVEVGAREVWIGRSADCGPLVAEVLPYDNISRRHAVLWCAESTLYVRDQSSTNGTFVNSRKLPPNEPFPLQDGDQVRFAADLTGTVRSVEDKT